MVSLRRSASRWHETVSPWWSGSSLANSAASQSARSPTAGADLRSLRETAWCCSWKGAEAAPEVASLVRRSNFQNQEMAGQGASCDDILVPPMSCSRVVEVLAVRGVSIGVVCLLLVKVFVAMAALLETHIGAGNGRKKSKPPWAATTLRQNARCRAAQSQMFG